MLENRSLLIQNIIDCLKANYGIEAATLKFLPIGADLNASVYKAQTRDKSSYFVKLKRNNNPDISIAVASLLYESGLQQVIPPIKTTRGDQTCGIADFNLIVYPFIEGQDGFNRNLTQDQWFILGKALRQLHNIEVPLLMKNQIRKEDYSGAWREAVRSFFSRFEVESYSDEIARMLLKFIQRKKSVIHHLVDRAEQLAFILKDQLSNFVLCHSDIHGGNVLMDDTNSIYIVD